MRLSETLAVRAPFAARELLDFLARRAIGGVESVDGDVYSRTLRLPAGPASVAVEVTPGALHVEATLSDAADAGAALAAVARTCDTDADAAAIDAHLASDPRLGPLVAERPGLRVPGSADGFETLVRAIVGQQVSVAGGRTTLGRIAAAHGDAWTAGVANGPCVLFPKPEQLAAADPAAFGMPRARGSAIVAAAGACATGLTLAPGVDLAETREQLLALPGVGPWTADYVAMRALGDRDAFLPTDLVVKRAVDGADAERWRPYRAHAVVHVWAAAG